jgi:hypothetical protein
VEGEGRFEWIGSGEWVRWWLDGCNDIYRCYLSSMNSDAHMPQSRMY